MFLVLYFEETEEVLESLEVLVMLRGKGGHFPINTDIVLLVFEDHLGLQGW